MLSTSNAAHVAPTMAGTTAEMMAAFDQLPPAVRQCLRTAVHNWAAHAILQEMQRGLTADKILRAVPEQEALINARDAAKGLVAPIKETAS